MKNITVLVSGGGTNFQALIDNIENGFIENGRIALLISSNPDAFAIKRAEAHGIKCAVIGKKNIPDDARRTEKLLKLLKSESTDLIVLAGYMSVLPPEIIEEYRNKIINIHPSLIPKYCGLGMYGHHVHEAVLAAGEKESGATVHFVDEGVDTGKIILQKSVKVEEGDTPETLAARVLEVEHEILPLAVKMFCNDEKM
ncbi:MAG: phosphoribosylglycinamide formyltransferase [Anaerovoracaceae bacterium]|nr:phosphoribosylglycinamide formyltransferase [Bacillota bacterium]MDD7734215.1 phosphoribosylglycinamide formyltransferase [Bacillota bacterium]MDY5907155.1 phosphoribosylglycinamide formyltransferase [Anaerovoracaceae bacterium]